MSKQIHVISARTFAVTLGDLTFYASGWKLTAERNFAEQGGATGGSFYHQQLSPCKASDARRLSSVSHIASRGSFSP